MARRVMEQPKVTKPTPAAPVDEPRVATSIRLSADQLQGLKMLAAQRRVKVNDILLSLIDKELAR